jgi:hypothetical protein
MVREETETIAGFDVDRPEKGRSLEWKTRRACLSGCSVVIANVTLDARE